MTQENVKVLGNTYYKTTNINADTQLDLYDTGRLLVMSGTSALTCSLPQVADIQAGWNVQIAFASDHSHSVDSFGALGFGFLNAATTFAGVANRTAVMAGPGVGSKVGSMLEIYFDGTIFIIRSSGTDTWDSLP